MVRTLFLTFGAWLTLAACGGTDEAATPPQAPPKPAPSDSVLAAWSDASGGELFWANGRTLEPVNDRSYRIPFFYGAAERSPDGAMLAVGGSETAVVDIVDLERMRSLGTIELPAGTTVDRLHWPTADRILASLWGERPQVAALQPGARKPIAVHDLDGMILKSSPAGDGLAILLAPDRRDRPGDSSRSSTATRCDASTCPASEPAGPSPESRRTTAPASSCRPSRSTPQEAAPSSSRPATVRSRSISRA